MADTMSIDNKLNPHDRDESDESIESPQDQDLDQNHSVQSAGHSHSAGNPVSQDGQQPKRKGGRKPVRQDPLKTSSISTPSAAWTGLHGATRGSSLATLLSGQCYPQLQPGTFG
jgi:hypothetical protein